MPVWSPVDSFEESRGMMEGVRRRRTECSHHSQPSGSSRYKTRSSIVVVVAAAAGGGGISLTRYPCRCSLMRVLGGKFSRKRW